MCTDGHVNLTELPVDDITIRSIMAEICRYMYYKNRNRVSLIYYVDLLDSYMLLQEHELLGGLKFIHTE